nr:PilW family protein [Oceanobacter mangrovi]
MDACDSQVNPPDADAYCSYDSTDSPDQLAIERVSANGTTCSGASLEDLGVDETDLVIDVFWVERDSGENDDEYDDLLKCASYTDSGSLIDSVQTLASGIEDFQVLYATSATSGFVPLDSVSDLSAVTAIRIGVLARAFSDAAQIDGSRSYIVLDGDPQLFDDGVLRQIFENTIYLMNAENVGG